MREQVCLIYFQISIFTIKESGLGGDRACRTIMAAFRKATTRARYCKADTVSRSTQTDPAANSNISTQTWDQEDAAVEQAVQKTSTSCRDSRVIGSADGVPEDAADDRADGATFEERMLLEEPQRESKLRESMTDSDFHDLYYGLPKVVADCVRAVFSAVAEFPRFATVAPHGEEVHGGERSEGAEDLLIEPESPDIGGVFYVPLPIYLPVMENIEKAFWEELDARTSFPEELIDEVFLPDVTGPAVGATEGLVSTELTTIEGFPEDMTTESGLERDQKCGVAVENHAADVLQAAMEALSHELSAIVSLETDEVEGDEATEEEELDGEPFEPLSDQSHEGSFLSEVTDEEMLLSQMDLTENDQIPNEDSPTNDFGSQDVKTSAEILNRNYVKTGAAGMKTFNETKPSCLIVTSDAREDTEGLLRDLCSTSTPEWAVDGVTQSNEQENTPVFEAETEF